MTDVNMTMMTGTNAFTVESKPTDAMDWSLWLEVPGDSELHLSLLLG